MNVGPSGRRASLRKDAGAGEAPPFRRVLVANRGEIAVRIIRACHDLGCEAVAVFSDADARSGHVRAADVAVRLGPAPVAESYLRGDRIVEIALQVGAEAIHPGYGFLAERADFAAAVEAAGVAFVGPASATIARLGDKLAARMLASEVGVAVVPGTLEAAPVERVSDLAALVAEAERLGFPLLVKAAAGGGGRGMRRVERASDLAAAIAGGAAEARSVFGDGTVYLEREIRPVRHVEVQLLGDSTGAVVALGERDCSIQRRHQKLVEEAPAPGLTDDERRALHEAAVRLGAAAGLTNASTAEFLFDANRRFWFLEVNTRLQVEHGVTELVADVDIVHEQLRIAAGRPLSQRARAAAAAATRPVRHAIEIRLSAEDPADAFAPAPGRVGAWQQPTGPGIRVDTAVEAGVTVSPDYDPLLAKVLVVDEDRPRAIERLARALDDVIVTGVPTTLPFARWLLADEAFRAGELSTGLVEERWIPLALERRRQALEVAARAVAGAIGSGPPAAAADRTTAGPASMARSQWPATARGWLADGRAEAVDRWPRR